MKKQLREQEKLLRKQDAEEGISISKELLIEAWCIFRPESNEDSSRGEPRKLGYRVKDIEEIFGSVFVAKLMANIKVRNYDTKIQKEKE